MSAFFKNHYPTNLTVLKQEFLGRIQDAYLSPNDPVRVLI